MSPSCKANGNETCQRQVEIPIGSIRLKGVFTVPRDGLQAKGLVIFAHGSGSGRYSPRNQFIAAHMHKRQLATVLFDLLSTEEEQVDYVTAHLRFDIEMLAERLALATEWLSALPEVKGLPIAYFGASTGAAAALMASATHAERISAIVSRGGRPDLAREALPLVTAPTLLIVGELDHEVIELNARAQERLMHSESTLEVVAGASHLFSEPGTLEQVAALAGDFIERQLAAAMPRIASGSEMPRCATASAPTSDGLKARHSSS